MTCVIISNTNNYSRQDIKQEVNNNNHTAFGDVTTSCDDITASLDDVTVPKGSKEYVLSIPDTITANGGDELLELPPGDADTNNNGMFEPFLSGR